MKRSILFVAVLSITIVWVYCDCKKNPVGPPLFNIRHLTWSIDTLAHPDNWQTGLYDIWGSSATDVYAVGIANTTRGILWHYNGRQWSDIKISVTQGGPIPGPISFNDVFCFGKNDVWVCGDRHIDNPNPPPERMFESLLIHWDGIKWEDVVLSDGYALHSIWGRSPDNVWFGGSYGTLYAIGETTYKRQGGTWVKFLHWNTSLNTLSINGISDDNLFAVGFLPNGISAVLHYNGRDWYSYKDVELQGINYHEVWTDGKEVFVAAITGGTTSIILHGK